VVSPLQLPILLTQLPQLQKVQHAQQSHPEAFQAQAAREVVEEQKRSQNQVPKAEESDKSLRVGPDSNRDTGGSGGRKHRKEKEAGKQQENANEPSSGRIIDIKV
jgi:hypothetical protein